MSETPNQFINHLEFLGYEIRELEGDGDYLLVHDDIGNTVAQMPNNSFASFYTLWSLDKYNHSVRNECLEAVNGINCESKICSYTLHVDTDGGCFLRVGAIFMGDYNKRMFGNFVNAYKFESREMVSNNEVILSLIQ